MTNGLLDLIFNLISTSLTFIIIIFLIYDHIKGDRKLTKRVQEFFWDLEKLVISFCQVKKVERIKDFSDKLKKKGINYEGELPRSLEEISNEHHYTQLKVQRNFEKYSKYLGLFTSQEDESRYINNAYVIIHDTGELEKRLEEKIIEDYSDFTDHQKDAIDNYLEGLRKYWNDYYQIFLMKPNLKRGKNIKKDIQNLENDTAKNITTKVLDDYKQKGDLFFYLGKNKDAIKEYEEGIKVAELLGNKIENSTFLNKIGVVNQNQGSTLEALKYYQDALNNFEQIGDLTGKAITEKAITLNNLGNIYQNQENYEEALSLYGEALKIFEQQGDLTGKDIALNNLGLVHQDRGDYTQALKMADYSTPKITIALKGVKGSLKIIKLEKELYEITFNYPGSISYAGIRWRLDEAFLEKTLNSLRELTIKSSLTWERLKNIGTIFYSQFIPPEIQGTLKATNIRAIEIIIDSSLLLYPWELFYDGEDFIGLKYNIGRRVISPFQPVEIPFPVGTPGRLKEDIKFLIVGDPTENLPGARSEAIQLNKQLSKIKRVKTKLLIGKDANRANFITELRKGYDIIHYCGHAYSNAVDPSYSGILLNDAPLKVFEIKNSISIENPPILVFMNATESNLVGYPFYNYGINYIGILWPIYDKVTLNIALSFYFDIFNGQSLGEALRRAKLFGYSRSSREARGEGISWASYILYGDPTLFFEEETKS
ncbi:MAG: CHAT domain-containing protein [Candidatus Lokiarchaeia archaeon]